MSAVQMIGSLLRGLQKALESDNPQQSVREWAYRVGDALESSGLVEDAQTWKSNYAQLSFGEDEKYFGSVVEEMKATLEGIGSKLEPLSSEEDVIPLEFVRGTRRYVEALSEQANGCYKAGWYDASAVLLRRLVEILIIDCFERQNIEAKVKDTDGNYYMLDRLIEKFLAETAWSTPRNLRNVLGKLGRLKEVGDMGAHGRVLLSSGHMKEISSWVGYAIQALVDIAYPG